MESCTDPDQIISPAIEMKEWLTQRSKDANGEGNNLKN